MADEFAALKRNLDDALEQYREAVSAEDAASRVSTAARNALNTAQKQFDAHVSALKNGAPRDSDWGRACIRATQVPA